MKQDKVKYIIISLAVVLISATAYLIIQENKHLEGAKNGMSVFEAIILGIVEGVTEYLPVSSTGHLLFVQQLLGMTANEGAKNASDSYAIVIQFGAILAVIGLFRQRVWQVLKGFCGMDKAGCRLGLCIIIAFFPAALIGLSLHKYIKLNLFGAWPIIGAWFVGGILLLIWRKGKSTTPTEFTLEQITPKQALIIGFFQCLALWPGMSRSLATIVGAVIIGIPLVVAVEFSFLLGCLTLTAAGSYELLSNGASILKEYDPAVAVLGLVFSFVSAAVSVKWLITYLKQRDMAIFGYYRIVLAIAASSYLIFSSND